MAYAQSRVYRDCGDGSIIGCFREAERDNFFEFSANNTGEFRQFPHLIWVTTPRPGIDYGFRFGEVKKTVCYIAVDENDDGTPKVEKWDIRGHRIY